MGISLLKLTLGAGLISISISGAGGSHGELDGEKFDPGQVNRKHH